MKRNIFNQYITASDFKGLFVSEMLWNNPTGATQLPEINIDNTTFHIEQIAERKGFQILHCQVEQIPSSARRLTIKFAKMQRTIFVSSYCQKRSIIYGLLQ